MPERPPYGKNWRNHPRWEQEERLHSYHPVWYDTPITWSTRRHHEHRRTWHFHMDPIGTDQIYDLPHGDANYRPHQSRQRALNRRHHHHSATTIQRVHRGRFDRARVRELRNRLSGASNLAPLIAWDAVRRRYGSRHDDLRRRRRR